MNYSFILIVLAVGASGIVAQVLMLRELLVSFYGNELTLGIIFANWVILEALGAFIIGKVSDNIKNKVNVIAILQIVFSLSFPLSIYLSRAFKNILGIPFGQSIGLNVVFLSSFFIMLPIAFCHGALFSAITSFYASNIAFSFNRSIGKVYTLETIGTIIGGVVLTYLFLPYLNSFQIVFIVCILNAASLPFLFKNIQNIILRYISLSAIIFIVYLSASGSINYIQRISIDKQWSRLRVLEYRNSVYGNIVATQKEKQYTFFYNGIPIITAPYPDISFVEEFGHLPLLFHRLPKNVLIISAGAGGLINEILKHPVEKIDYVELDSLIIGMLKKYPSDLTRYELSDKRVNIINLDGRLFLKNTKNNYDVVLVGISCPSDISTNRFFTQEFFSLVRDKLSQDGILAFRLPGSLTYLSQQLKDLNSCVLNGLKTAFNYVRVIPGDYNMFLSSNSKDIMSADQDLISQRMDRFNIKTNILIPDYLDFRLSQSWLDWFNKTLEDATKKINLDFEPLAVFELLVYWNKQFSPRLANILNTLEVLSLKTVSMLVFIITFALFCIFYSRPGLAKLNIAYSIVSTGFFGMLINIILIFSFQVLYGYLYRSIGILISIFMAGIAFGSIFVTAHLETIKNHFRLFVSLELAMAAFSYCLALTITKLAVYLYSLPWFFMVICFIPGVMVGAAFPLAAKLYSKDKKQAGQITGILYCSDLIGGWVAGICAGIIFLPILGLFKTCMIVVMLKISSFILLITARDKR